MRGLSQISLKKASFDSNVKNDVQMVSCNDDMKSNAFWAILLGGVANIIMHYYRNNLQVRLVYNMSKYEAGIKKSNDESLNFP